MKGMMNLSQRIKAWLNKGYGGEVVYQYDISNVNKPLETMVIGYGDWGDGVKRERVLSGKPPCPIKKDEFLGTPAVDYADCPEYCSECEYEPRCGK